MKIDAIWQADNQQRIFRKLLQTFSQPGSVMDLSVELEESNASLGVLATLLDSATTYCDAVGLLSQQTHSLLQSIQVIPDQAAFLLSRAGVAPPDDYAPMLGDLACPENSTTIILDGCNFDADDYQLELTGPGVNGACQITLGWMHRGWLERREIWNRNFPMGVDLLLTDRTKVMALPRTTRIRIKGGNNGLRGN